MKKSNINYPHPVLSASNDDYINSAFEIVLPVDPYMEGDLAKIEINYSLISQGIQELIQNDKATVVVYLESVEAEYRKIFYFAKGSCSLSLEINKNNLSKGSIVIVYSTYSEKRFQIGI